MLQEPVSGPEHASGNESEARSWTSVQPNPRPQSFCSPESHASSKETLATAEELARGKIWRFG